MVEIHELNMEGEQFRGAKTAHLPEQRQINYEVRLKNNPKYEVAEVEESLRSIFELFDDGIKSLIPKQDKDKIVQAISEIMDEIETKELMEAMNVVEECVAEVIICEESLKYSALPNAVLGKFYLFNMDKAEGEEEHIDEEGDGEIAACQTWMLPNKAFYGLWESLHYSSSLKSDLIQYAETSFRLSQLGVSNTLISWNKVILFHGPPGTGKTSIAQAFAQKLAIRQIGGYQNTALVEINSHSLFSKWFSESGKLVQKMFAKIRDYADDQSVMTIILIDEVESLTSARSGSANEPADAVRVVNAVLTQLDSLKKYPNVLVVCTSNITGKIDLAFIDRADMKIFVGPPEPKAIYTILESSIHELFHKGMITGKYSLRSEGYDLPNPSACERSLIAIADNAQGISGRTLRKIPFLALMKYCAGAQQVTLDNYLNAVEKAIESDKVERKHLSDENIKMEA
ncbi:Oidioi.mRNA.OKI2018_I69.XSR.g16725.t1.cds [Oikopleura dioica]|uniref:Pachytene checkpoint protein 2 homolog n=1 Tax=Oikopleura dioica TaxID=34765 RepID=A0ABN7SND2_OIKDI|nr:Oidioi.mRNA.OKI2018_I69.XSR.g16725.t1.cds [Oikopleura dioica]